jgi:hypothetical protein
MEKSEVVRLLGAEVLDLGPCLLGESLNLLVLRGYAGADVLAAISAPDIYDMVENPKGTQRNLNPAHARDARTYAIESGAVEAGHDPRAFPELLLNVRDRAVVEVYTVGGNDSPLDFDSFADPLAYGRIAVVGLRVYLNRLEFPLRTRSPQISRVDGNHRLSGFEDLLEELASGDNSNDADFPIMPFALLVGLNQEQEAKLFRDVNGTPMKMETDYLLRIEIREEGSELKENPNKRALWIADELTKEGRAFAGKVFFGGSPMGVKRAQGKVPEVRFNSLRRAIDVQLSNSKKVAVFLRDNPDAQLRAIDTGGVSI